MVAAAAWRVEAAAAQVCLRRLPFLGAWPRWQRALAASLHSAAAAAGAACATRTAAARRLARRNVRIMLSPS